MADSNDASYQLATIVKNLIGGVLRWLVKSGDERQKKKERIWQHLTNITLGATVLVIGCFSY